MSKAIELYVHLLPSLIPPAKLNGATAVVIDVLRATTTMVHALAAGCKSIFVCAEVAEARELAGEMRKGRVLLAGERDGKAPPEFDLGNSPLEFTPQKCRTKTIVMTTTNGTRALLRAAEAASVLVAAFVNFSAVCEQLQQEMRPIHIVCAGTGGEVALEDVLLAGALVEHLCDVREVNLNDSARLAWDCFENQGSLLREALELSLGGTILTELGFDDDIAAAARVDRFTLVPELRRDPLRIEIGAVGIVKRHWTK